jgi:hypothetical protein
VGFVLRLKGTPHLKALGNMARLVRRYCNRLPRLVMMHSKRLCTKVENFLENVAQVFEAGFWCMIKKHATKPAGAATSE